MDYFRYIIKRILYKIPFKLLLLIGIVLFLFLIIIGSDVFAAEYSFEFSKDGVNYTCQYYDEGKGGYIVCGSDGMPLYNYYTASNSYYDGNPVYNYSNYINTQTTPVWYMGFTYNSSTHTYRFNSNASNNNGANVYFPSGRWFIVF